MIRLDDVKSDALDISDIESGVVLPFKAADHEKAKEVLENTREFLDEYYGDWYSFSYAVDASGPQGEKDYISIVFTTGTFYSSYYFEELGDETETDCPFLNFLVENGIEDIFCLVMYLKDESATTRVVTHEKGRVYEQVFPA